MTTGMESLNNVMKAATSKEVKYTAFPNMDFSNTELKDLKFVKCNFNGADFSNAELFNVEFENCTGNNAIFSNANLYACKFNSSRFDNANFTRADISVYSNWGTEGKTWNDIENSSFKSASFNHAHIEGMNIGDSDFKNADFKLAKLKSDKISNSDFREANLCSQFERTEFKDTKLENTGLDNIESYKDSGVLLVDGKMRNPTHKDYIDKKDFLNGFAEAQKEGISEVEFMQSVIERHGINEQILFKAASAVADSGNHYVEREEDVSKIRDMYISDLIEEVKNTDTYKIWRSIYEYNRVKNRSEQYLKDIQGGNYDKAYNFIPSWNYEKETAQKIFMRDVIKEHGTKEIESALNVVADKENMSLQEKAKLFQGVLETDEYKQALNKEQGKTQEAVNAR